MLLSFGRTSPTLSFLFFFFLLFFAFLFFLGVSLNWESCLFAANGRRGGHDVEPPPGFIAGREGGGQVSDV
jgi:hypothetical protein